MKSNKAFQETYLSEEISYLLFECYPKSLKEVEILKMLCLFSSERIKKELQSLESVNRVKKVKDGYKLTPGWYRSWMYFLFA